MGLKYYKQYKVKGGEPQEVTKENAKDTLGGCYKKEFLDDIFDNEKSFRLETPFSVIWTNIDGQVPMAGFYGVCE